MIVFLACSSGACTPAAVTTVTAIDTTAFLPDLTLTATMPASAGETPGAEVQPAPLNAYDNRDFGVRFQFPSDWFGPEEYFSGSTLRVEIGSDVVYPYGTDPTQRVYQRKNSYSVVIQASKNDPVPYWNDTIQSLAGLKDGESISDGRGVLIRVRQVTLGRFTGYEFISTLSETAQTEPVYVRQIILRDKQANLVTIMGSPNNVEIGGSDWRQAYQAIDQANLDIFHQIIESLIVE